MKKAVILVSGGLDSCVTAACAIKQGYEPLFLHINYNQLTQERELRAFNDIADYYNVKERLVVDIEYLRKIGGSSLTDCSIKVEEGTEPKKSIKLPSTYVPFRNGNLISIAASWAEAKGAGRIFIGAVDEDSSGYPDCTQIFFEKFNELFKVGLSPNFKLQIETPVINLLKSEIIKLGVKLNAPRHLTWSCYQNQDKACGVCESCYLRLKGFKNANLKDSIEYINNGD